MGGVASAGKSMAKSVAKPFKRKAAQSAVPAAGGEKGPAGAEPAEPRAVAAGTARAQSTQRGEGKVGHSGPSAATAASLRGQAESKSSKSSKAEERQVQGSSKSSKIRREALRGETPKTLAADKEMVPAFGGETPKTLAADKEMVPAFGGETPKTLAADKEMVPAFGLSGSETPKTLAADKEMVPAFGAVADTLERLPDGSNTPEQESPMKAGATPKPSTREVPEPWVKVPFEDDFYFWNTQTDETTWDIEDCFASITPREDEAIAPAAHWAAALGLDSGSSEEELGQVASEMREAKAWPSGGTAPLPLVESKPEVPLPPGEWLQREVESEEAPAATEATEATSHPQPAHPEAPAATEATEATSHPAQSAHPHEAEAEAELWEVTAARLPGAPESPLAERAEQLAAGRLRALVAALEFYDLWKHRKSWTKVVALRAAEALSPSSRSWSPQGAPKQSASPGTSPKRRKNRSVRKKEQETDLKPENNEAPVLHRVAGEAPETALEVLPEVLPKVEVKEVSACLRCGKGISPKGPNAVPGRHARSAVALAPRRKKGLPPKAEKKALAKVYSGPMLPRPMKSQPAWQYP